MGSLTSAILNFSSKLGGSTTLNKGNLIILNGPDDKVIIKINPNEIFYVPYNKKISQISDFSGNTLKVGLTENGRRLFWQFHLTAHNISNITPFTQPINNTQNGGHRSHPHMAQSIHLSLGHTDIKMWGKLYINKFTNSHKCTSFNQYNISCKTKHWKTADRVHMCCSPATVNNTEWKLGHYNTF